MIVFSNQILLVFSLYDLRCIILTIGKQIIAFKKGTFAPPAPPSERLEGRLLPLPPLRRAWFYTFLMIQNVTLGEGDGGLKMANSP